MQINITGHHIEITNAIEEYIKDKMSKVKHHFDQVINIQVILEVVKNTQMAEATIHISGADIFAKVESDDMYISIDKLVKKLDSQIIKHKEKQKSHRG